MEWLTRQEAADRLKIGIRTLDDWISKGWVPAYKKGGTVRLRSDEVDDAMSRRESNHDGRGR